MMRLMTFLFACVLLGDLQGADSSGAPAALFPGLGRQRAEPPVENYRALPAAVPSYQEMASKERALPAAPRASAEEEACFEELIDLCISNNNWPAFCYEQAIPKCQGL